MVGLVIGVELVVVGLLCGVVGLVDVDYEGVKGVVGVVRD